MKNGVCCPESKFMDTIKGSLDNIFYFKCVHCEVFGV